MSSGRRPRLIFWKADSVVLALFMSNGGSKAMRLNLSFFFCPIFNFFRVDEFLAKDGSPPSVVPASLFAR